MTDTAKRTTANVIPALRYHDAAAAIEWLCRAFGFEKHAVYPADGGKIAHAQLAGQGRRRRPVYLFGRTTADRSNAAAECGAKGPQP